MINDLNLLLNFVLSIWNRFMLLYTAGGIFSIVFAIYLVNKVSRLLNIIR